jgi:hypothetical protein
VCRSKGLRKILGIEDKFHQQGAMYRCGFNPQRLLKVGHVFSIFIFEMDAIILEIGTIDICGFNLQRLEIWEN